MAAPRKKPAPSPEPKAPRWLAHPAAIAGTVMVLTGGLTYACDSIRTWLDRYDLWNRGSELAIQHEPQVQALQDLVTQQADLVIKQDQRITLGEKSVAELRKLKEREEERLDATRDYQRQACAERKLDQDLCRSLSYPVPAGR